MNTALSTLTMLVVAPIAAVTTLVLYQPDRWGGTPTVSTILVMAFFGLITVPLWLTYIPALVATPFIMRRLASRPAFASVPLPTFIFVSALAGALGGVCILSPAILMATSDSRDLVLNWLCAGAVAGAISFPIITALYRASARGTSSHAPFFPNDRNA